MRLELQPPNLLQTLRHRQSSHPQIRKRVPWGILGLAAILAGGAWLVVLQMTVRVSTSTSSDVFNFGSRVEVLRARSHSPLGRKRDIEQRHHAANARAPSRAVGLHDERFLSAEAELKALISYFGTSPTHLLPPITSPHLPLDPSSILDHPLPPLRSAQLDLLRRTADTSFPLVLIGTATDRSYDQIRSLIQVLKPEPGLVLVDVSKRVVGGDGVGLRRVLGRLVDGVERETSGTSGVLSGNGMADEEVVRSGSGRFEAAAVDPRREEVQEEEEDDESTDDDMSPLPLPFLLYKGKPFARDPEGIIDAILDHSLARQMRADDFECSNGDAYLLRRLAGRWR